MPFIANLRRSVLNNCNEPRDRFIDYRIRLVGMRRRRRANDDGQLDQYRYR